MTPGRSAAGSHPGPLPVATHPAAGWDVRSSPLALPDRLLDIRRIYLEPAVETYPRGRDILDRFPDAERVAVKSHWMIPSLHHHGR